MRLLTLIAFFITASCSSASTNDTLESWFALTFTPTSILASRINASGSIEVTKHAASLEYQAYYYSTIRLHDTCLRHSPEDRTIITSIFRRTIAPVTESLGKQLGHAPDYAAIFLSVVFDSDSVYAAGLVLRPDDDSRVTYAINHAHSRRIAADAFGFLEGNYVGSVPDIGDTLSERFEKCEDAYPLILVLEYEKQYLSAGVHTLDWEQLILFMDSDPVICFACGEQARESVGEQTYAERVTKLINDLIDRNKYGEREDIRAIVLFGEASTPGFEQLGIIARNAVGIEVVQIVSDLAPWEAAPHGAAMWARLVQGPSTSFMGCPPGALEWYSLADTFTGLDTPLYNRLIEAPGAPLEGSGDATGMSEVS